MSPTDYATDSPYLSTIQRIAAGVPEGPFAEPIPFLHVSDKGKFHARPNCSRIKGHGYFWVDVDVLRTPAKRYCAGCTDALPTPVTRAYAAHAVTARVARRALLSARAKALAAEAGRELDPQEDADLVAVALDIHAPIEVDGASWALVSEVEAIDRSLADIVSDPDVSPVMLDFIADLHAGVRELNASLREAAAESTDTEALTRSCVIDLMGTYSGGSKPEDSIPQVSERGAVYPALCSVAAYHYAATSPSGFKDLVLDAWRIWREEVRATADVDAARSAAISQTTIGQLEPLFVAQLGRGVPCTPPPDSGSLWDWQVAEWRLTALDELHKVLTEWEDTFALEMSAALEESPAILRIDRWDAEKRTTVNASNRVLNQLRVEYCAAQKVALVYAPGAVARWLKKFDVYGHVPRSAYSDAALIKEVTGVSASEDPEVVATALLLWQPAQRYGPLGTIEKAVDAARGVHAPIAA